MAEPRSTPVSDPVAADHARLGELLVQSGLLNPDEIPKLLALQARYQAEGKYRLFGQLCVEQGLISGPALQGFLKKQGRSIRLGELLIKLGAITGEDLQQSLAQQKKHPDKRLGELLIERKAVTEQGLIEALSQQLDLPVLQPSVEQLDFALLEGLDLKFMHESGCLPLSQTASEITVVMFHPNDMNAVNFLEMHFGKKLHRTLAPLSQVRQTLKDYYLRRKAELEAGRKAEIEASRRAAAAPKPTAAAAPAPKVEPASDQPFNFLMFEEKLKAEKEAEKQASRATRRSTGLQGLGDEDEDEISLVGLSLGGGDEDEDDAGETAGPRPGSMYDEPAPRKQKPKPEPAKPEPTPEPEPIEVEDNLIVGGVSLSSGKSQFKQQEGMLNYLIKNALHDQASAIRLEPQGMFIRVRYRIDGVLNQKTALPANLGLPMVTRLKQICALNPEMTTVPQRARVQASFNERQLELSLATYPGAHGETMVLNLRQKQLAENSPFLKLELAGFSPLNLRRFKKLLGQSGGMLIVTGPGRSGKTTTVYAALNELNLLTRSITTAERPIEVSIPGLSQGNWTPELGLSFPDMIRTMNYLDSDVMMISELDSGEAIEAAVELALAGAKVISSFQSFDSLGALMRLKSLGLESFLISSSNVALLSQRLLRRLCPACRVQEAPPRELLDLLGLAAVKPEDFMVWAPRGCADCNQLGYKGQTVLHELLVLNESMREALLAQEPAARIRAIARNEGKLVSMAEDGYYKAVEGITSLAEVQRVAYVTEYDSHSARPASELIPLLKGEF